MLQPPTAPDLSAAKRCQPKDIGRHRREHLRHIHRMTHEQQIALVEEARAARRAEESAAVSILKPV